MRNWLLLALAASIPGFLALGCSGGNKGSGKPRFAVVSNNSEEFWTIAEKGAEKASKDFDCEVVFRKPAKGLVSEQKEIVDAMSNQGFDGIAVSVIDPVNQSDDLKQLAKKTKIITIDNDAAGSDRLCYIGTDNVAAGKAAGRLVAKALPSGGQVAVFVGLSSPLNAQQRFQGVKETLKEIGKAKGVEYVIYKNDLITDNVDRNLAVANAKETLEQIGREPNVCLVGLWAYNPPALLEAVTSKPFAKHVKIVGFDEYTATLDGIAAGKIEGTIVQDPFNFAYKAIECLAAEVKGDTSKRVKEPVPYRVVTADGKVPPGETAKGIPAAEFKAHLDALLGRK